MLAASGLVRRECYEHLGVFPLDMPWAGDWYLWCLFALHYDVAYFAEPMVCYREHDLSMTNNLMTKSIEALDEEGVAVVWGIKEKADRAGFRRVSKDSLRGLASIYGRSMASGRLHNRESIMTWEQFEASLARHISTEAEKNVIRSQACAAMADHYYWTGDVSSARRYYQACIGYDRWNVMTHMKTFLLDFRKPGNIVRKAVRSLRKYGSRGAALHRPNL